MTVDIEQKIIEVYSKIGLKQIKDKSEGISFSQKEGGKPIVRFSAEDIAGILKEKDFIADAKIGTFETSIKSSDWREYLIDVFRNGRPGYGSVLRLSFKFGDLEKDGFTVEIGPASEKFVRFMSVSEAALEYVKDRSSLYLLMNPTIVSDFFSRMQTVKIIGSMPDDAQAEAIIDNVLFEMSYMKGLAIEISERWPSRKLRDVGLIRRRVTPGREFPLKRVSYNKNLIKYYKRAISINDPIIQFLSFYHIIEYFFLQTDDEILYDRMRRVLSDPLFRIKPRYMDSLIMKIEDHRRSSDETEMLKNVIAKYVDKADIVNSITDIEKLLNKRIYSDKYKIFDYEFEKINTGEAHIIGYIAKRIKIIRIFLVHSSDRYERRERYVPGSDTNAILGQEIHLLKFLAEQIIIATSTPNE